MRNAEFGMRNEKKTNLLRVEGSRFAIEKKQTRRKVKNRQTGKGGVECGVGFAVF
jgi:hypothetical protein